MTDVDLELLADQLVEWNARMRRVESIVEALDAAAAPGVPESGGPTGADQPAYASVEKWVAEHFAPMYGRPLGGEYRWCARWQEHAEALSRLEALWRSWETLRLDPAMGMAAWYRDHLDHHLPLLLGNRGPFSRCSPDRHEIVKPLPCCNSGWTDRGV